MKFLFDLFPVIAFFAAYKVYDIYVATLVLMVAVAVQSLWAYWRHKRLENSHKITLVLVLLFGGATLLLKNPLFIQWKPTILNWLFALAFAGSHVIGDKPLIRRMMDGNISLPDAVWIRLSQAWIAFFLLSGLANIVVAYRFDENTWVNFKLFGLMGMTILFVIAQAFFLAKYIEDEKDGDIKP